MFVQYYKEMTVDMKSIIQDELKSLLNTHLSRDAIHARVKMITKMLLFK